MPGASGPAKALSRTRRAPALGIALAGLTGLVLTGLVLTGSGAASGAESGADAGALARGAYVFRAAGCAGCHTDPKRKHEPLAGGSDLFEARTTAYAAAQAINFEGAEYRRDIATRAVKSPAP